MSADTLLPSYTKRLHTIKSNIIGNQNTSKSFLVHTSTVVTITTTTKDTVDETLLLTLKYLKNYFPQEKIKRILDILFFSCKRTANSYKLKSCLKKETYKNKDAI